MGWEDSIKKDRYRDSGYDDDRPAIAHFAEQRALEIDESLSDVISKLKEIQERVGSTNKVKGKDTRELKEIIKWLEDLVRGYRID